MKGMSKFILSDAIPTLHTQLEPLSMVARQQELSIGLIMVAIVTQIEPQWVAFHIGHTKNNRSRLYSRHFDTDYWLLLQWKFTVLIKSFCRVYIVGHYCQSTWWPAAHLQWTPSVANPQNTCVFKISPWNENLSLMRIQWATSTAVLKLGVICCCRFLESVDDKVSGLRRELEERQPDGHSHDIVDRSTCCLVMLTS